MSNRRTTVLARRLAVFVASSAMVATLVGAAEPAGASEAIPAARADAVLDAGSVQQSPSVDIAAVEQLLTFTVNDVAGAWSRSFVSTTVQYLWVGPGQVFQTACGLTSEGVAFYCPADDAMYHVAFAGSIEAQLGDMAAAMIVAHEYGHNLQAELGVAGDPSRAMPTELHADCLGARRPSAGCR